LFSLQNYIFEREAFFNSIVMNLNSLRCSHFNIVLAMVKRIPFVLTMRHFLGLSPVLSLIFSNSSVLTVSWKNDWFFDYYQVTEV